ncbi:MAG: tetratricopeptide repeat protein [Streptosporangiaceae bacterium]
MSGEGDSSARPSAGSVEELGAWLRHQREIAGLTRENVAELSALSVRAISDLERGKTSKPYPRSIRAVADALGLPQHVTDQLVASYRRPSGQRSAPLPGKAEQAIIPRQMPPAPPTFVGRSAELRNLDAMLGAGPSISLISGTAGIGKTTLAVYWAYRSAEKFPDGQLYVNLRGFDSAAGPVGAEEAVGYLLDSLLTGGFPVAGGNIPKSLDSRIGLYRSMMADRRMTVILDNALDEAQVRPLLPGAGGSRVIVTSRMRLDGLAATHSAQLVNLDTLSFDEAHNLLLSRLGKDRMRTDADASDSLIRLCAGHPLALAIVAARAAGNTSLPLATFSAQLTQARSRLSALDTGDTESSLRATFSWSCRRLSEAAALFLYGVGIHPTPDISGPAAASIAGLTLPETDEPVREAMRASLLTEYPSHRYACHDLLHLYLSERARQVLGEESVRAATQRLLDHYLHAAVAASTLLYPHLEPVPAPSPGPGVARLSFGTRDEALAWFEAEREALVAAVTLAADSGFLEHAWRLPLALKTYLSWRGFWPDERAVLAAGLSAVRQLGDQAGEISIHRSLDHVYARLGDYARAIEHIRQARGLCQRMNDVTAEAYTYVSEAWVFGAESRYEEALASSLEALSLFRKSGHLPGQASALNSVGWFYVQSGDYESGRKHCRRAFDLSVEIGNMYAQANALNSLGYIEYRRGNPVGAIELLRETLAKVRELGDRSAIAETLDILGDAYLAAGDRDAASDAWREAVDALENVHDERSQRILGKLRFVPAGHSGSENKQER